MIEEPSCSLNMIMYMEFDIVKVVLLVVTVSALILAAIESISYADVVSEKRYIRGSQPKNSTILKNAGK
ncbi:MAG: hypothetical protein ACP5FL_08085 [Thermoplasmatota archaeon]